MKNKIRKIFLPTMLGASMLASLTGCGKKQPETTEVQETVQEETKLALTDEEIRENRKYEIAEKTYTEYKQYYDYISVSREEVGALVDVINGDVEGYTKDQINDSLENIQYMLCSDNTLQLIDNCNAIKLGFEPYDSEVKALPIPKVSELLVDNQDIDQVIKCEELWNEIYEEIIATGTYSEATAQKINEALVDQEVKEYDTNTGNMDSSLNNEGTEYAICAAKLSISNLAAAVNPTNPFVEGENGDKYQLYARSDVNEQGYIEADVLSTREQLERDGKELPIELELQVAEIEQRLVPTKYINGLCTLTSQLLKKAGYEDDISMRDLLKGLKDLVELKKQLLQLTDMKKQLLFTYVDDKYEDSDGNVKKVL